MKRPEGHGGSVGGGTSMCSSVAIILLADELPTYKYRSESSWKNVNPSTGWVC